MLSFAIVSLSACSASISSRTGAPILHGPHHSAQKSTSTGLSLPSTSLAKLVSVTFTVLPAMVVLPLVDGLVVPTGATGGVVLLCPVPDPSGGTASFWFLSARRRSPQASARRRWPRPHQCRPR